MNHLRRIKQNPRILAFSVCMAVVVVALVAALTFAFGLFNGSAEPVQAQAEQRSPAHLSLPQILNILNSAAEGKAVDPMLVRAGLEGLPTALWMSGIGSLETPDQPETGRLFREEQADHKRTMTALENFKMAKVNKGVTGENQALARDMFDAVAFFTETQQTVNAKVRTLSPSDESLATLDPPKADRDPSDGDFEWDSEHPDAVRPIPNTHRPFRGRNIRTPWLPWTRLTAPEELVKVDTIEPGECMIVVKETNGLGLKVTWRWIPIYVEPWTNRQQVVGFKRVWLLEWVPKEIVKTITYCNKVQQVRQTIRIQVIEEPQVLQLWRYFRKDP